MFQILNMRIKIIQVGKTKEKYLNIGINEFIKRLSPYAKLEIITLKESSPSKTFSREKCKEIEADQIIKNLDRDAFIIALDETGKEFDSVGFSKIIKKNADIGKTIIFIIGGHAGLDEKVKKASNMLVSFSKMTFTHQMFSDNVYCGTDISSDE